jgi:hypothetical protein
MLPPSLLTMQSLPHYQQKIIVERCGWNHQTKGENLQPITYFFYFGNSSCSSCSKVSCTGRVSGSCSKSSYPCSLTSCNCSLFGTLLLLAIPPKFSLFSQTSQGDSKVKWSKSDVQFLVEMEELSWALINLHYVVNPITPLLWPRKQAWITSRYSLFISVQMIVLSRTSSSLCK